MALDYNINRPRMGFGGNTPTQKLKMGARISRIRSVKS